MISLGVWYILETCCPEICVVSMIIRVLTSFKLLQMSGGNCIICFLLSLFLHRAELAIYDSRLECIFVCQNGPVECFQFFF